jgi:amino acid permease
MIAEMILHTEDAADILGVFNKFLFKGRAGKFFRIVFFILLVAVLIANLSAYISGASEIFTSLLPVSETVIKIIFFVIAAVVVFAGLAAVCTGEAVSVSLMALLLVFMGIFSVLHIKKGITIPVLGSASEWMAAYGMIMFSFSAIFAVPQVVRYLGAEEPDAEDQPGAGKTEAVKKIRISIWLGLLINLAISAAVAIFTIITSFEVTKIAIVGWADAVGGSVRVLGSVFIVFAMLTSFWSIGLAAADIVAGEIGQRREISFTIATVPALILTLTISSSFTDYLKLVGGVVAIIISLMAVPSFLICMKDGNSKGIMKAEGAKLISVFVFVMYIVMAVGSCVEI